MDNTSTDSRRLTFSFMYVLYLSLKTSWPLNHSFLTFGFSFILFQPTSLLSLQTAGCEIMTFHLSKEEKKP
jgi:hypothetical protein